MKCSLILSAIFLFTINNAFAPVVYEHGTNTVHYYPPNAHITAYDPITGNVTYSSTPHVAHSRPHYHISTFFRDFHPRVSLRHVPPHMTRGHPANHYSGYYDDFGNFYFHYRDYRDGIIRTCFFNGVTSICHY